MKAFIKKSLLSEGAVQMNNRLLTVINSIVDLSFKIESVERERVRCEKEIGSYDKFIAEAIGENYKERLIKKKRIEEDLLKKWKEDYGGECKRLKKNLKALDIEKEALEKDLSNYVALEVMD